MFIRCSELTMSVGGVRNIEIPFPPQFQASRPVTRCEIAVASPLMKIRGSANRMRAALPLPSALAHRCCIGQNIGRGPLPRDPRSREKSHEPRFSFVHRASRARGLWDVERASARDKIHGSNVSPQGSSEVNYNSEKLQLNISIEEISKTVGCS